MDSANLAYPGELNREEAMKVLEDLAGFKIPALLMSGGEPTMHPDFFSLAEYAKSLGLRLTLSTNGTLITQGVAERIVATGFTYVGISFDGLAEVNDRFRGMEQAFVKALAGLRRLKALGQRVGLRFTLTKRNIEALPEIFQFVEEEKIDRVCFYHLVYAGRGRHLAQDDLSLTDMRRAVDFILRKTRSLVQQGWPGEVLTVDNHVDGVYLYLALLAEGHEGEAQAVRRRLSWNGGGANSSGVGIGHIDSYGNVHPDQFWQEVTLGSVRERPFSQIWQDESNPVLASLRDRLPLLKGRCGACRFKALCGGSFRVRAQFAHGDPWAPDPACYLTDEEIGVS
jgi:radical SAM protein with 4Fe4S-binding SPASM domain